MSLSDKIVFEKNRKSIAPKYVKQFIKDLKKRVHNSIKGRQADIVKEIINKLAGKELIEEEQK